MRAWLADVEHRQAVDVDTAAPKRQRKRPGIHAGGLDRRRGSELVKLRKLLAARESRPLRRLHPRDPSAFLVNQDWHVGPPAELAQGAGQRQHLRLGFAVALEEDEAGGIGVPEECAFVSRNVEAGEAVDRRLHAASSPRSNSRRRP